MKEIGFMMAQIPKKSLRLFLLVYVAEIIVFGILNAICLEVSFYYMCATMGLWIFLYYAHLSRLKVMLTEGALNRILLLPIQRRSFVWSELLFISASVFLYYLIYDALWFGSNHILFPSASFGDLLLLNTTHTGLQFFMPEGIVPLIMFLLNIVLLTVITLVVSLSVVLRDKGVSPVFAVAYTQWAMLFSDKIEKTSHRIFICFLMIFFVLWMLRRLNRIIGFRRKKVVL